METPKRVSIWSFHQAPPEFRESFPESGPHDWVVYVPLAERPIMEPSLLRWRDVYPVRSTELPDQSAVFCGAPSEAMRLIVEQGHSINGRKGTDRRAAARVPIAYPSRYELSEPKQSGMGRTIDMSSAGIAFTTESLLPPNARVTLHVEWPVRLDGNVPVELHASGRLARSESTRAAMQLESVSFSVVE
jgi:hypothetical protein